MAGDRAASLRGEGDLRLAIVVDPKLVPGLLANTVAAISVGLGAVHPGLGGVGLTDANGTTIYNSADRPVPILQADAEVMRDLLERAAGKALEPTLVVFPAYARSRHTFTDYEATFGERSLSDEKIDGIGLCGSSKRVKSLTGSLKLLR